MTQAWLFDPHTRTCSMFQYSREQVPVSFRIRVAATSESITPYEYYHVSKLLGAREAEHVAMYTIRNTPKYVYKVWARDMFMQAGPGTRFYKTNATFYEKLVVIKMKRNNAPIAELVECEQPTFEWMDAVENPQPFYYSINNVTQEVQDLLYKCGKCNKCCGSSRCGKCKRVFYCNSECQKAHWKQHKKECC